VHRVELAPRVRQVVAREDHEIRLERVRLRDGGADDLVGRSRPDVEVRELRDAQAVVCGVEAGDVEGDPLRLGRRGARLGGGREHAGGSGRADERGALDEPSPAEPPLHP
jgi:hypothetical protein